MEIIFHSHANKTHFHKKGCAPSLILKVRVFGTRKWPIYVLFIIYSLFNIICTSVLYSIYHHLSNRKRFPCLHSLI